MLENISVLNFLIFATSFGFAVAIIYTNIQRTALSKFITYLVSNAVCDEESSVDAKEIGLNAIEKIIIKSSVKNKNGLKKYINCVINENKTKDKLEQILENSSDDTKYYLSECDTELLIKKYSFKTIKTKQLILFIAALIIVVLVSTLAVNWLIRKVSIPKIEDNTNISDTVDNESAQPDSNKNDNADTNATVDDSTDTDTAESNDDTDKGNAEVNHDENDESNSGPINPYL